jgi:hypothetical protein
MERISVFIAIIASLLILFQWFIFATLRKYLFQRYDEVSRQTAYCVLAALGLLNVIAVRLVFDSDTLAIYPVAKLWGAVAYFSFLGCVLLLTVAFGLLSLFSRLLDLKDLLVRAFRTMRHNGNALQSQKGCISSFCKDATCEGALCSGLSSTENPLSACSKMQLLPDNEPPEPCNRLAKPSRRAFLKWSAAAGVVVATAAAGHGVAEGYERPLLEKFDFFHNMLDGLSQPITVIQITDFHFGLFLGIPQLERLVEDLNLNLANGAKKELET